MKDKTAWVVNFSQLWHAVKSKAWLICAITVSSALLAGVGSFCFYQDKYQSSGTLMLNSSEIFRGATDIENANHFFKEEGGDSNSHKNQQELLKSRLIAQRTLQLLQKQGYRSFIHHRPDEFQRSVLSAKHIKDTDFMELSAQASSPAMANHIAKAYVNSYLTLLAELSDTPLKSKKAFFQSQMQEAEQALVTVNNAIRAYQERYGIIDITVESQNKVRDLLALDTGAKTIEAELAQRKAEASKVRAQLQLKKNGLYSALQAVAAGQDTTLVALQQSLQDLQKEYHSKALVYAPSSLEIQQIQQKIDIVKSQIADLQILNVGQTGIAKIRIITDPVRIGMVSRLAESESAIAALQSKLVTLRGQYFQMQKNLQGMPKQQLEYAHLLLDQKNKESALVRLKEKLSEVQIQKAASGQKLQVIDSPSMPTNPLFPSRIQIVLLSGLAGFLLTVAGISAHTVLIQKKLRPEWLERMYDIPVLAMIPWLPEQQWQAFRRRGSLEITASRVAPSLVKAYQDLAINLKVQRNLKGNDTLVVSSVSKNAGKSIVLANLAFCLAQSGEKVILIDANLREPKLHTTFNQSLDYERSLPELINSISDMLYRYEQVEVGTLLPIVQQAAVSSGIHPQLHYLNAGVTVENTFEFLNSRGFGALIQILKAGYDWILIDSPPFLQSPDAAILLGYADSLLLLAEVTCDESQILAVQHKVERLNSSITGVVLRKLEN